MSARNYNVLPERAIDPPDHPDDVDRECPECGAGSECTHEGAGRSEYACRECWHVFELEADVDGEIDGPEPRGWVRW